MSAEALLCRVTDPLKSFDVVCEIPEDKRPTGVPSRTFAVISDVHIGYGFGDTSAASENILFYDGVGHKLDDVTFLISDNYTDPWKFTSSDGRFEMDFMPIIDRAALLDVKLICSDQHQVFGRMSGTAVLDDGTKVVLKDFLCFAEKVHNKY